MQSLKEIKLKHEASRVNATSNEIAKIEADWKLKLPLDFKKIMQECNGLTPIPVEKYWYYIEGRPNCQFSEVVPFQQFGVGIDIHEDLKEDDPNYNILDNYLPFGITTGMNQFMIGYTPETMNKIYYWNMEFFDDPSDALGFHKVADNYIDFFNNCLIYRPDL